MRCAIQIDVLPFTLPLPDQLVRYPIATRRYTGGLGREQVAYKPDQAVVELGRGIWAIGTVELI